VKIINVFSGTGGDGRTMAAAHLVYFGAELLGSKRVAGVSIDRTNELSRHLRSADLMWFDGTRDELPTDLDLLVLDVCNDARSIEVLRPNLWLLMVDDPNAEHAAAQLAPTLAGRVMRVRNYSHGHGLPEDELDLGLQSTNVVLHRCNALASTSETLCAVWADKLGAHSAGAREIREFCAEVFGVVGLLPPEDAPYVRAEPLAPLAEREQQGIGQLAAFFEKFEAATKAEGVVPAEAVDGRVGPRHAGRARDHEGGLRPLPVFVARALHNT
jgi:hypothetical protein